MPGDNLSSAAKPKGLKKTKTLIKSWTYQTLAGVMHFGVSMRPEVLRHKQEDGDRRHGVFCYYTMPHVPAGARAGSKLWVASGGRWRGYFVLNDAFDDPEEPEAPGEVQFFSESWIERDGGPRKPFQGFTYKVPEAK